MHGIPTKNLPLSPTILWCGMNAFLSYDGWPDDFHAPLYGKLHAEMQKHGFTQNWWDGRMDDLSQWRATRSSTSITKSKISTNGVKQLVNLKREYNYILNHNKKANIEFCDWKVAKPLFDIAARIKPVQSPVFASKLCHFILPELFPVFDMKALRETGKMLQLNSNSTKKDYRKYWEHCRTLWIGCNCKPRLKKNLRIKIKDAGGNPAHYPWMTRIPEICLMNPNPKYL